MSETIYIYELTDTINKKPMYVGLTNDPERRLQQHVRQAELQLQKGFWRSLKYDWMFSVMLQNGTFNLRVISDCNRKGSIDYEQRIINMYIGMGYKLTNRNEKYSLVFKPPTAPQAFIHKGLFAAYEARQDGNRLDIVTTHEPLVKEFKGNKYLYDFLKNQYLMALSA